MSSQHHSRCFTQGFTLIEMLTVLVIIAILAQYLVSVSMQAREKAYRANCISNLRQLLQACKMYESDYGQLPVHCHGVYQGIDFGEGWWQQTTFPYVRNRDIYLCPLDPDKGQFAGRTGGGPPVSYAYLLTCPWLGPHGEYRDPAVRSPLIIDPHHMSGRVIIIARYDGSVENAPLGRYEAIRYEPEDGGGPLFPPQR
ncbi:MAG: DUF1559 domain-containing protein [Armatimonadota bacterium]